MLDDSINVNQEFTAKDGWRVELDKGTTTATLFLVFRSGGEEVRRLALFEYKDIGPNDQGRLNAVRLFVGAYARALNCGVSADEMADWLHAWRSLGVLQYPPGWELLDTLEESTRQHLFSTPAGIHIVTEDQYSETVDPGELLTRLDGELLPYEHTSEIQHPEDCADSGTDLTGT